MAKLCANLEHTQREANSKIRQIFHFPSRRQADMTVFAFGSSTRRQHFLVLTVDKVFSFNY